MKCESCGLENLSTFFLTEFPGGAKISSCGTCFRVFQAMRDLVEPEVEVPA
ncbi:hypothetical protein LCGC14_2532760 [marine sediment metagenome]|uniref:Uncharacterized protein n=1 Tax=marine sediment metagenome TaxID=412755 RepID=A0A0F9AT37_9ZZZZ